jgi:hypothetical protein
MTQQFLFDSINQDEINAILWKACDTFHGTEITGAAPVQRTVAAIVSAR